MPTTTKPSGRAIEVANTILSPFLSKEERREEVHKVAIVLDSFYAPALDSLRELIAANRAGNVSNDLLATAEINLRRTS